MTTADLRPATLYLTRTGLLEPLGQSQVLSYARGLSKDYAVIIVSFERENDLHKRDDVDRLKVLCDAHGICWKPYRYRAKPRVFASMWNLVTLVRAATSEVRHTNVRLIHARSYIPAAAAWLVARLTGVPFIFDMRSLWPEELITSRRMRRGSLLHRLIFWAEGRLLGDAAAVVSLTRAGASYLQEAHPGSLDETRLTVIPTCTDLERFRPRSEPHMGSIVIGCHGSIASGWFRIDLLAAMFSRLSARLPDARFEIITRENPQEVLSALQATGRLNIDVTRRMTISSALPSQIHDQLKRQSLSLFFYAEGEVSELGRSPTRMGEALGCGTPVITNSGIGDTAEIVRNMGVGLVLEGDSDSALDETADAALRLIRSPDIAARCRATAEALYSLTAGVDAYREIYKRLANSKCSPVPNQ